MFSIKEIRHFDTVHDTYGYRTTLKPTDNIRAIVDTTKAYVIGTDTVNNVSLTIDLKLRLDNVLADLPNNPGVNISSMTIQELMDYPLPLSEVSFRYNYRNSSYQTTLHNTKTRANIIGSPTNPADMLIMNNHDLMNLDDLVRSGIVLVNGVAHRAIKGKTMNEAIVLDGMKTVGYTKLSTVDVLWYHRIAPHTTYDLSSANATVDLVNKKVIFDLSSVVGLPDLTLRRIVLSFLGSLQYQDNLSIRVINASTFEIDLDAMDWLKIVIEGSKRIDVKSLLPGILSPTNLNTTNIYDQTFINNIIDSLLTFIIVLDTVVDGERDVVKLDTKSRRVVKNVNDLITYPSRWLNGVYNESVSITVAPCRKKRYVYRINKISEKTGLTINGYTPANPVDDTVLTYDRHETYVV